MKCANSLAAATELTAFVSTIGDEVNFAECLACLKCQTIPFKLEIVDRIKPMSAAFQQMHDRCDTPYYVQVDEDMMLIPTALASLRDAIAASQASVALVCAPLWDCDLGIPIYGVKIYRHAIVKQFPYRNVLGCDAEQLRRLEACGFQCVRTANTSRDLCLGEHGKHYTPYSAFVRWQRLFRKHRAIGNQDWLQNWPEKLLERYVLEPTPERLSALLGALAGLVGEGSLEEYDFQKPNVTWLSLREFFGPLKEE